MRSKHWKLSGVVLGLGLAACGTIEDGGPTGPTLLAEPGPASSLALDDGAVYVATSDRIARVERATGAVTTVAPLTREHRAVTVIVDGDDVLWTELPLAFGPGSSEMRVNRAPASGGAAELVAATFAGDRAGEGLAADGDDVYFTVGGSAVLWRVASSGGALTALASSSGNFGDLARFGDHLVFDNAGAVVVQPRRDAPTEQGATIASVGLADDVTLAIDESRAFALASNPAGTVLMGVSLPGGGDAASIATWPSMPIGDLVVGGDHVVAVVGGELHRVDLATSAITPLGAAGVTAAVGDEAELFWGDTSGSLWVNERR